MKRGGGSSCKGYGGGREGGSKVQHGEGTELISFNTRTSSDIRITMYLINAVYSVPVCIHVCL